jgi:ketosteroid isomerase-like protein
MEGTFHGLQGLAKAVAEWTEPWEEHRVDAEEVEPVGDHVLAVVQLTGRGAGSGMEVSQRFFQVYEVRDGKITGMIEYVTRAEALESARAAG